MAFVIKCRSAKEARTVADVVRQFIARSRFVVPETGIMIQANRGEAAVSILGIRLKQTKCYCGNHAGPCRLTGKKHKRARLLEGLDWVSWNDMLNDALDSIGHNGNAASSHCIIRKGRKRRTDYASKDGGGEWEKDADEQCYVDCIGQLPSKTKYPNGTPGIIGWESNCSDSPYEEEVAA